MEEKKHLQSKVKANIGEIEERTSQVKQNMKLLKHWEQLVSSTEKEQDLLSGKSPFN